MLEKLWRKLLIVWRFRSGRFMLLGDVGLGIWEGRRVMGEMMGVICIRGRVRKMELCWIVLIYS